MKIFSSYLLSTRIKLVELPFGELWISILGSTTGLLMEGLITLSYLTVTINPKRPTTN
jgi:hypothetical protein